MPEPKEALEYSAESVKPGEFVGTAAAATVPGRKPGAERAQPAQTFRSTIVLLMAAMALAGLRCLGQELAQFMMVWQR